MRFGNDHKVIIGYIEAQQDMLKANFKKVIPKGEYKKEESC